MIMLDLHDDRLNGAQQAHVNGIAKEFCDVMAKKYASGQAEHGGNLWDLTEDQLLNNAIEEAIDQVVYLITIRGKRAESRMFGGRLAPVEGQSDK